MRKFWLLLMLIALAWMACGQESGQMEFEHGGRLRHYRLHVPPRLSPEPALVLALHGGGGNARQMERHSGFSRLADEFGFVVAYPEGIDHSWNDGRGDPISTAHRENIDDLGFLTRLAEQLLAEHSLDAHRVYVTGISNGGFMSQRLGAEAAHRFVAIAPVVAGLPTAWCNRVQPSHPVSVMILQGTADPLVPYGGGYVQVGRQRRGQMLSTDQAVQHWVRWNGCQAEPQVEAMADLDPNDGCRAEKRLYAGGRQDSVVELWRIEGGGHTWPGASQYLPRRLIGPVCRDFSASREIWQFFQKHPRSR